MATEATRNCKILICKILGLSDFQQGSDSVPDKLHDLGSHGALCFNAQCAPTISVTRSNADRSYVRTHPKQITLVSAPPYQLSFASGGSERWGVRTECESHRDPRRASRLGGKAKGTFTT